MATKKIEIRPKGTGDYADILYPKTSADMVIDEATGLPIVDSLTLAKNAIPTSQKGQPNGVAPLDANGSIPEAQMQDVALTYMFLNLW